MGSLASGALTPLPAQAHHGHPGAVIQPRHTGGCSLECCSHPCCPGRIALVAWFSFTASPTALLHAVHSIWGIARARSMQGEPCRLTVQGSDRLTAGQTYC